MFGCNSIKEVYFGTATNRRLPGASWSIIAPPFIKGLVAHFQSHAILYEIIFGPIDEPQMFAASTRECRLRRAPSALCNKGEWLDYDPRSTVEAYVMPPNFCIL